MRWTRTITTVVFAAGLALGSTTLSGGCGSGSQGQTAAELSPEVQQKTDEMLKNYGKMYNQQYRSKKGRR